MLEKEIRLCNLAYEKYNSDKRENLTRKILDYIKTRIIANKDNFEILLQSEKDLTYEEILNTFEEEMKAKEEYKKEKRLTKIDDSFMYGTYTTSIGNIAVETSKTLSVLKYFIKAIQTRNTITISDEDYDEKGIKFALYLIFSEALEKFEVDKNLIKILPYEECFYDKFDKVIYEEENKITSKPETDILYIYKQSSNFNEEIENEIKNLNLAGKKYEILTGEFYSAIEKINKSISPGACIYTTDPKLGYKFINLVHSKNVFVNSSLLEANNEKNSKNELYMIKKIMYPLGDK